MAPVYSTVFIRRQGLYPDETYAVPAGFVAVVRDIELYWNGPSVDTAVHVIGDVGQTFFFDEFTLTSGQRWGSFTGRVVCLDSITITTDNDPVDATVSGYLLSLP